jgi:hypothetical protein
MNRPLDELKHMDMLREVERQAAEARLIREAEGHRPGMISRMVSALTGILRRPMSDGSESPLPLNHARVR